MGLFDSCKRRICYKQFKKKNDFPKNFNNEHLKVLFFANGGMGDLLSSICYIERFYSHLAPLQIDFLVHTNRKQIILDFFGEKTPPFLNAIYSRKELEWKSFSKYIKKEYDLFVELCGYVPLYYLNHPKAIRKRCPSFFGLFEKYKRATSNLMAGHLNRPHYDGHFAQIATYKGLNRKSFLGHLGQIPISNDAYIPLTPHPKHIEVLKELGLENSHYITLHSGSDIVYEVKDNLTTKQWPTQNYEALIQMIKANYPSLKIIYLKGPNSSDVKGAHITLETSFNRLLWILKYSKCHIDCESGLVRIARELHSRSVVIFGPTNYDFFKLSENENLKPTVCGNCFWLDPNWQTSCMKGYKEPPCTRSITVESVFKSFEKIYLTESPSSFNLTESINLSQGPYPKAKEHLPKVGVLVRDEKDLEIPLPTHCQTEYIFVADRFKTNILHSLSSRGKSNLSIAYGSIYNLPGKASSYDLLICNLPSNEPFLEYAFKEFLRVLKDTGKLKVTFDHEAHIQKSLFKKLEKLCLLKSENKDFENRSFSPSKTLHFEKVASSSKMAHTL